ncbi:hypothetical protein GCM10008931_44060 [Oceanobacillus oncorhynchi subsp. oncorhynchi]|uniref:AAA family ATPase n=1 Tax=Oceanobacillus oncorhynchi TaxID=545501 RepID=UPI0031DB0B91
MSFVKPEERKEGTKFLFYGTAGSGKTPIGLSFPDIALIDSDSGSNFYSMDNVKLATGSLSYKELEEDLDELEMEDELFDSIQTFTIDSLTRFHETMSIAMNKVAERRALKNGRDSESENLSFREYGKMKTYYEEFYGRLVKYAKLGKNIVFIAEQKDKTENVNGEIRKVGVIPNSQKDIEYDFDVCVRTFQEESEVDGKKVLTPKGIIIKDRTGTFEVGEIIDKPNYSLWQDAVEKKQQGKQRSKDEIKTVREVSDEETKVLDDGESLRAEVLSIVKSLNNDGKVKAKEVLTEKVGTHEVNKINDVKKLQTALDLVKSL